MSFPSAIAGPSRLPYVALRASRSHRVARSYATAAPRSSSSEAAAKSDNSEGDFKFDPSKDFEFDGPVRMSYSRWLTDIGFRYQHPAKGQKAKWLGGEVPFPDNPTFRPPPPLSDALQTEIYDELLKGERTIGMISQKFNVSKARIEAIQKLKEIEAEFRRQNMPLQQAYQKNMETLLGSSLGGPGKRAPSAEAKRNQEMERVTHTSTSAELDEEQQKEDNISVGGAFGDLRLESRLQGLEKDSWEFKSEATVIADKHAKEAADAAPEADKPEPRKKEELPSTTIKPGKTVYRFIDTSKRG